MQPDQTASSQPLDMIISSLLYLLTRHNNHPCPNIREAIVHHLIMLHDHPNARNSDAMVKTAKRLANEWLNHQDSQARPAPSEQLLTLH